MSEAKRKELLETLINRQFVKRSVKPERNYDKKFMKVCDTLLGLSKPVLDEKGVKQVACTNAQIHEEATNAGFDVLDVVYTLGMYGGVCLSPIITEDMKNDR